MRVTQTQPHVPPTLSLLESAVESLGGATRTGQQNMAAAIEAGISTGVHIAVQAGTGTGKSLAYLVPAIRHAITQGTTVVISTATIALQRQLIDRDLPRLAKALKPFFGRTPTFAIMKGRGNYLCSYKQQLGAPVEGDGGLIDEFELTAMGRSVKKIGEWADETTTGDRDELVPGVSDSVWRNVSVSARECLGVMRCPVGSDCFAEKAKAIAQKADIVVTNHALLAIDALEGKGILPEHDVVVIDEAHDLVDRVTSVAADEITETALKVAVRRSAKLITEETVDRLAGATDGLSIQLAQIPPGRLDDLPQSLALALTVVRDAAHACVTSIGPERRENNDDLNTRKQAITLLGEIHDTAARILEAFDKDAKTRFDVVWIATERDRPVLRVAPLTVSGLLRERLFSVRTTILTSATLTLGGNFDAMAGNWGLKPAEQLKALTIDKGTATDKAAPSDKGILPWRGMDVGSPFEHGKHGILYIAKHLPIPGRDGLPQEYLDELAELIEAAGGRTLGLFSSARAAKQASEALRKRLSFPILAQGDDSMGQLVKKFADDPKTCLFGTLTLWQGVDVPGSSLQLVVMDRIPFPRPDDPLASARQKAIESRGGNGFLSVAANHAALLLAQGSGRLLRSIHDRGVVAILDPRIATARYGGYLRASIPPMWPTTDPKVVRQALTRLNESAT
jgi:ATP-dependent DNA helicase DinG